MSARRWSRGSAIWRIISDKMNEEKLPTVAIIGKPNVGKSSLFNRLIGSRKAIVFDEPGVTRDVNYATARYRNIPFRIADSTGFVRDKDISERVNRRLIGEASLVVCTCDIEGLGTEDFDITELIRRSGKPCILVINKTDNEKLSHQIYDFYDLGIEDPIAISALHGRNITALQETIVDKLELLRQEPTVEEQDTAVSDETAIRQKPVEIAIVGKPNVGKSSLLNLIAARTRSLVLPEPGTTRDTVDEIVEFAGKELRIVDTAGIRRRRKNLPSVEFFSIVRAERAIKSSTLAVLLIDANSGITAGDKKIASIIVREKKGLIIAANKWDTAKQRGMKPNSFREDVYYQFPHIRYAEVVPVSAKTGYNKIKLLKTILTVYDNYNRRVQTSDLNQLLRMFTHHGGGIKYGYQKAAAPPVFEFFINKAAKDSDNFKRFIGNSIRQSFPFTGVPIEVLLRK